MKNTISHITRLLGASLVLAVMAIAGCTKDRSTGQQPSLGTPVELEGGIVQNSPVPGAGQEWQSGDAVGLFMLSPGGNLPAGIKRVANVTADNLKYNVTPGDPATSGSFTPADPDDKLYYPQSGSVDLIAYYPYGSHGEGSGEVTEDYKYNISTTDQSDQAPLDVLYVRAADRDRRNNAVPVEFAHVMSKVTLNLRAGDQVKSTDIEALEATNIEFGGMPATAALDIDDGSLSAGADLTATFHPLKAVTATENYDATFTAILVPQAANAYTGRRVAFTVNGEEFVWCIPDAEIFEAGVHYNYSVTVLKAGIKVDAATIAKWADGGTIPGSARSAGIWTADDLVQFSTEWNAASVSYDGDERRAAQAAVIEKWSNDGTSTGTVCLRSDIDMTYVDFTPIGWASDPLDYAFTGKLDGRGHTIKNLKVNVANNAGLFGMLESGGSVSNLVMEKCNIAAIGNNSGGIVGLSEGSITDCSVVDGIVEADSNSGGITGNLNDGSVTGCSVTRGTVKAASSHSGGITGSNNRFITGCSVTDVTVEAKDYCGGIAASNYDSIIGCSVNGAAVKATLSYCGGIVGFNMNASIISCIAAPIMVNGSSSTAVIAGYVVTGNKVTDCYWLEIDQLKALGNRNMTGGGQFTAAEVTANPATNYFQNPSELFSSPIEIMNDEIRQSGWEWVPGTEASDYYPVITRQ